VNRVDFTPQWYRLQLHLHSARKKRLVLIGVLLILMGTWWVYSQEHMQKAQSALQSAQQDNHRAEELNEELRDNFALKNSLVNQLKSYIEVSERLPKQHILSEISYWIPPDVWLANFKLRKIEKNASSSSHNQKRWKRGRPDMPKDLAFSDMEVSLTAEALEYESLQTFFENLNNSPLFEKVLHTPTTPIPNSKVKKKAIVLYVISSDYFNDEH